MRLPRLVLPLPAGIRTSHGFPVKSIRCLFLLFGGLLATSASAALVTYDTRSAWNNAVMAPVLVDFENIEPPNEASVWYPTPPGVTVGGVRFDIPDPANSHTALMILGTGYYERPNAQLSSQGYNWASVLTVNFPTPVLAAAFSIWGFGAVSAPYEYDFAVDTGGLASTLQNGYGQSSSFLGIVSTVPFTTVTISSAANTPAIINLDNVSYATAVPEPCAWLWVSSLGLCVGVCRRRRKGWCT